MSVLVDSMSTQVASSSNQLQPKVGQNNIKLKESEQNWEIQQIKERMPQFMKNATKVCFTTLGITTAVAYTNLPIPVKVVIIGLVAVASLKVYTHLVNQTVTK